MSNDRKTAIERLEKMGIRPKDPESLTLSSLRNLVRAANERKTQTSGSARKKRAPHHRVLG